MSRIGKKSIEIPMGVEVKVEGRKVIVKGPRGELFREVRPEIEVEIKDSQVFVRPLSGKSWIKQTKAFWGLTRTLIANMIKGVTEGYIKELQLEGLGYRAVLEEDNLVLQVGFSHSVKVVVPEGIKFSTEKNIISVSGINKELVGQTAAKIRKIRPPEPYKGKGIRYLGEVIRRKTGKKTASTG